MIVFFYSFNIYMSLATLKKKSRVVYGERINSSTVSQNGFSLNGVIRVIGSVGPTNLAKSVTRTPFKGSLPKGHGGGTSCKVKSGNRARACGSNKYPVIISNSGSCSTSQTGVKLSTKNTRGMLHTKEKWMFSTYPRYVVHRLIEIEDMGEYIKKKKTTIAGCPKSTDKNVKRTCSNRYHIGGKLYMKDNCGVSKEKLVDDSYSVYLNKLKYNCLQLIPVPHGFKKNGITCYTTGGTS